MRLCYTMLAFTVAKYCMFLNQTITFHYTGKPSNLIGTFLEKTILSMMVENICYLLARV